MPYDYDCLVIGSGPAGQRAAIQASKLGKSVLLIERQAVVGGVCINTGTIPSRHCAKRCFICPVTASAGFTARLIR